MSSANKCDRCGKFYDEIDHVKDPFNERFLFNQICTADFSDHRLPFRIDLCQECLDSFVNWVKKGEENEHRI